MDLADRARKADQRIEHVKTASGHAERWRLGGVVTPAIGEHAGRIFVGEMSFDVHDIAEHSPVHDALEFAHRWEATPVVTATERYAGIAARRDRPHSLRAAKRQRLFAPHRLA